MKMGSLLSSKAAHAKLPLRAQVVVELELLEHRQKVI
jgi:hypothetical protein